MENLTKHLIDIGALKSQNIINGFKNIDRINFVKEDMKDFTYIDEALPIGFEQTISQPYTVAFMLELLQPEFGDRILEIGFGSGWQTALLAYIVTNHRGLTSVVGTETGKSGKIYSFEIIPELCDFGRKNIDKYGFIQKGVVEIFCQDASEGLPEIAKEIGGFDKIIAAAAIHDNVQLGSPRAKLIPEEWKKQLKIKGRMVLPINQSIWLFIKKSEENFEIFEYPGFIFVPFVK